MTIERLYKYRQLVREIKDLEKKLHNRSDPTLHDSVQSSDGPGNTQREVLVYGSAGGKSKLERRYIRCKKKVEKEMEAISDFIESVDDPEMRMIMRYRFIEKTPDHKPLSWQAVAMRMGWTDESTPRQRFADYHQSRIPPKKIC